MARFNNGFSLIELVVSLGFIALVAVIIFGEIIFGQRTNFFSDDATRASFLAQEKIEILRNIRDADFFDLTAGTTTETIDNYFERQTQITDVDNFRKEVVVIVKKINQPAVSVTLRARFANWLATVEDWSQPNPEGSFDFTPENSGSNNHNAKTVTAVGNYLYIGNANSAGKELIILDITKVPVLTIKGTLDLDGSPQKIAVSGGYIYIASDSNTEELQVIDAADPANPRQIASFNLTNANSGTDNSDALSIESIGVQPQYIALGRKGGAGEELFIFDAAAPTSPQLIGKLQLDGTPADLKFLNNKLFIASDDDAKEFQIVDLANPQFPVLIGGFNLDSGNNTADALALDIKPEGDRLYLGRAGSNNAPEFYLFNISNANAPQLLSIFNVGGNGADIKHLSFALTRSLIFALTDDTAADFQTINIANELSPALFSKLDVSGSPNQADYSPLAQKMFVAGQSNPEIQIVAPRLVFD